MAGTDPFRGLLYCRAGFEKDCAAEFQAAAAEAQVHGFCRTRPVTAHVQFEGYPQGGGSALPGVAQLVFARQLVTDVIELSGLEPDARLEPIVAGLARSGRAFAELRVEYPDSDEGKVLAPLARSLHRLLQRRLAGSPLYRPGADAHDTVHVFLPESTRALIGRSWPAQASPWLNGIPRLRLARDAPSRAALKLEEALLTLLTPAQRTVLLQPGMTAVDLGAAPGGWTWQLTRHSIRVTAIDNAALDPRLEETGLVCHRRTDGFHYRPPAPVDWLVCDMVEQPRRIAALVVDWLAAGDCRQALFNLKLPMRRRLEEIDHCRNLIDRRLKRAGVRYRLSCKQLYHDRREVTALLQRL